ncbi:hypothetical protein JCM33374_g5215 [Metschnikowia sp. JCM 33374]|nr:hypothetical protein JCM33374_g5215 [Metschnikowia sp. JCM 33374]
MDILASSPSPAQIESCIQNTQLSNDVHLLRLVSALLKYTVPEAYVSLPETCQNAISRVFRTAIGLGNLSARIAMFSRSKADLHRDISSVLDAHTRLLDKVLAPGLVTALLASSTTGSRREIEKLLFKGKIYSIVREAAVNFSHFHVPNVLRDMDAFTAYLAKELLALEDAAPFTVALLSSGNSASYFDVVCCKENAAFLHRTVMQMKRFERKMVLVKFLDFAALRFLGPAATTTETALAVSVVCNDLVDTSLWDDLLLEKVVSRYNYNLNLAVALSAHAAAPGLLKKFLASWGSTVIVGNEPIVKQGYRTHLLLCICAQLAPAELQAVLNSGEFVSAVTSRLSSLSNQVKFLGVFLADRLSIMAGTPPIFDMNNLTDMRSLDIPVDFINAADFALSPQDAWDVLESPHVIEADAANDVPLDLQPLTLKEDDTIQRVTDVDMSDEEDDPTLATKGKVPRPIYVRDLLAYLSVDTKDANAYEKRKIALDITPTLLRQKSAFGTEVSFYAQDLLAQLVGLTNHYEEEHFETSRLNAMIAVVVSYPDITPHLCKLLLTGDYSLQQRLGLLSAMSFGARALRGYKDEVVEASFTPTQFPTQMLPQKLHQQYTATDYGYSRIENAIQNDLMNESSEEARDAVIGGKVLRVSAKLRKEPAALEVSKDQISSFREIVGRVFFFPLIAVWYESGGINIGHYTPVLIAHYVRSLSLILHCAYPAALDLNDMAGEYLTLVTPLLQKVGTDQLQVIESVVTGVLLICETLDQTYLVTYFDGNLHIIESIISQWWESLIDDRVKSLCAGLLLKLNSLKQNMERTILDQMNGGFYA